MDHQQADPPDGSMAWGVLVESRLRQASTTTSTPRRGLRRLPIRTEPTGLAARDIRRELAEVPNELFAVFGDLVTGKRPWPLYLWGPAGCGKTSAALVMLDYAGQTRREHEPPSGLRDWMYGYAEVRSLTGLKIQSDRGAHAEYFGFAERIGVWDRMLGAWAAQPVVVLDEIGVGTDAHDFRLDTLLEVLNTRTNDPVKPTIVTGNTKPSDLARVYDDRVSSRVLAGTAFHLTGRDRRTQR